MHMKTLTHLFQNRIKRRKDSLRLDRRRTDNFRRRLRVAGVSHAFRVDELLAPRRSAIFARRSNQDGVNHDRGQRRGISAH